LHAPYFAGSAGERQFPTGSSVHEYRLKKLKELKESGVLTEEEYRTKRKKLVDEI